MTLLCVVFLPSELNLNYVFEQTVPFSILWYSVLMARLFPHCEYEAGSSLISGWNSFPSIASFSRRLSGLLWEWGGPVYLCVVCVWETEGDPLSPQGYIITWIIRPGQPEKEESKKAIEMNSRGPLCESYRFWKMYIARTQRVSERDESLSVLSNKSEWRGAQKKPLQKENVHLLWRLWI